LESYALEEANTAQEAQTRSQAKVVLVIMLAMVAATLAIVGAVLLSR
jgi:flagellar basal body-associated protein FliL